MFQRSLAFVSLAPLLLVACDGGHSAGPQSRIVEDTITCVDNVFCIRGSHWDPTTCRCQPIPVGDDGGTNADADATDGAAGTDGGMGGGTDGGMGGPGDGNQTLCGATGGAWGFHCGCAYGTCSSPTASGGICPQICIPACTCPDGTLWDDQNGGGCIAALDCGAAPVACPIGQTSCDGVNCTDLTSDPGNCGACGTACSGDQSCSGGGCVSADAQLCSDTGGAYGSHCGCAYGTCSSPTANGGICPDICVPACTCPDGALWDDQYGQGCIPSYDCFF